jgi:hypothetical protein
MQATSSSKRGIQHPAKQEKEPGTMFLFGTGMLLLVGMVRRKRKLQNESCKGKRPFAESTLNVGFSRPEIFPDLDRSLFSSHPFR